jgi:hypothetical protein
LIALVVVLPPVALCDCGCVCGSQRGEIGLGLSEVAGLQILAELLELALSLLKSVFGRLARNWIGRGCWLKCLR